MIVPTLPHSNPWESIRALQMGSGRSAIQNDTDEVRLFAFGRQALAAGLRSLPSGSLLVPAYICDTAVDTLPAVGTPVRFYPVKEDLTPDWDWLDQHRSPEDTALLLVHNFGFPNDIPRAVEYCQYASLSLIEDCAHSFLSEFEGEPLGKTGDLAVFCYRKTLPLYTGAGLYSTSGRQLPAGSANTTNTNIWAYRQMLSWAVYKTRSSFLKRFLNRLISRGESYDPREPSGIDRYSRSLMERLSPSVESIRVKRRRNYSALAIELKGMSSINPIKPVLLEGVSPWGFPLRVEKRDELLDRLRSNGVGAWSWPGIPRLLDQEAFSSEARLARETLMLPIHQDIEQFHIDHMVKVLSKWTLEQPIEQVTWEQFHEDLPRTP
ncbi:MAG: DegT/DnrJ/EryC1/StrS family aminotransferase [Chloroflexi bacterium]|nr:DegT/DnrJ/EryC1/StrS family aminotransferase [Chloroflexota bacterium]